MKTTSGTWLAALLAGAVLSACASTPNKPAAEQGKGVAFRHSLAETHRAATDALVVLGFDVKKSEPTYLEAARPHKVGLFVGSGGETIGVWLEALDANRTRVQVNTAKSFVGYVGQRTWDDQIIAEMEKTLGPKEGS